jgi:hypothetical protein
VENSADDNAHLIEVEAEAESCDNFSKMQESDDN